MVEQKSSTFIHLVPVCLPSGTGGPRHNIPLYSLSLRQTLAKIRPEGNTYRALHHRTISSPLTPTDSTPFLPSPPYSHSLFHCNLTRDLTKMHQNKQPFEEWQDQKKKTSIDQNHTIFFL